MSKYFVEIQTTHATYYLKTSPSTRIKEWVDDIGKATVFNQRPSFRRMGQFTESAYRVYRDTHRVSVRTLADAVVSVTDQSQTTTEPQAPLIALSSGFASVEAVAEQLKEMAQHHFARYLEVYRDNTSPNLIETDFYSVARQILNDQIRLKEVRFWYSPSHNELSVEPVVENGNNYYHVITLESKQSGWFAEAADSLYVTYPLSVSVIR